MTSVRHIVLVLLSALYASIAAAQTNPACQPPYSVGYRVVTIPSGLKMAVWYPTSDRERDFGYTPEITGSVAPNGAVSSCERFPLVVFSHGLGGCGTQSIFLTEHLARSGYIIAAPDHKDAVCSVDGSGTPRFVNPDEAFVEPFKWTDATHADRKDDLVAVMNWMLGNSDFGPRIDPDRIGASGHSLGGYTVMGMAGGWASWKNPRIRAALTFSPYLHPFLFQGRLSSIDIPIMYEGAQFDIAITPFIKGATGGFAQANLPKFFMELFGGNHLEWTNLLCAGINRVSDCLAQRPNARLIVSYAATFFDRYLRQQAGVLTRLNGAGLAEYSRTVPLLSVVAASYEADAGVAPDSIASAFGDAIATATASAAQLPLPTTLGNSRVEIKDSSGVTRSSPLFFASSGQINYLIPAGVSMGAANVSVVINGQTVAAGPMQVNRVAPALFSADASGKGVAAAQYLRASQNGNRMIDLIFNADTRAPVPVDLGSESDAVYLMLYGTGLRGASGGVSATIGGQQAPVVGPARHSIYEGLDQINLGPILRSLVGRGLADIVVTIDGRRANIVTVNIR